MNVKARHLFELRRRSHIAVKLAVDATAFLEALERFEGKARSARWAYAPGKRDVPRRILRLIILRSLVEGMRVEGMRRDV
jgi:hypothetical protein